MVGDESEHGISRSQGSRKTDDGLGLATPHRAKRINLGTPANYYFKYMNSSKKNATNEFSIHNDEDEDTGTMSIPGFQIGEGNANTETSFFSMAGSSTSSEGNGDLLNKSTLSDTTELTASNFVLVTTSKQNMKHKNKSLGIPAFNKENSENSKDNVEQNKSALLNRKENVIAENQKSTVDRTTTEKRKEPPGSKSQTSNSDEGHDILQQRSIKGASPSLRSRISSSPASLRKFHENLKNSRMKRQQQREEDTKRRLSVEGKNTLDSMNAQLEALANHSVSRKERLPPPFTQISQQSPSQEAYIGVNTCQSSPATSSPDGTGTIDMADLDELLGIKIPAVQGKQASITAQHGTVQHALNDESSTNSFLEKDETSTLELMARYRVDGTANSSTDTEKDETSILELMARYKVDGTVNPSTETEKDETSTLELMARYKVDGTVNPSTEAEKDETSTLELMAQYKVVGTVNLSTSTETTSVVGNSNFSVESKIESRPSSDMELQQYSSPSSATTSMKLQSASSNPRKIMTPSKLSSTPKRVVNPQSMFSPASNTRSAKKRRKLVEEQEKSNVVSAEDIAVTMNEASKIGMCLFHKASTRENGSYLDSEASGVGIEVQHDQGDSRSFPSHNDDDTASLGDIADLFGASNTTDETSLGDESSNHCVSNTCSAKKRRKLVEEQEKSNVVSADDIAATTNKPSKIGMRLFHEASTNEINSSLDSEASDVVIEVQRDQDDGRSFPSHNNDTASLGDIADLFGTSNTTNKTSLEVESSNYCRSTSKENDLQDKGQETASISDINDLIKQGFLPSQESSGRGTLEKSQMSTAEDSRVSHEVAPKTEIKSFGDEDLKKKKGPVVGDFSDPLLLDESNVSSVSKEENEPAPRETSDIITDEVDLILKSNSYPGIAPELNVLCTTPDIQTASSQPNLTSGSPDRNVHLTKVFPKSPIRLTPNHHQKPTPSKLAPTPRRVMNPMNPNSPARNTRSSLKGIRPIDSSGLNSIMGGEPNQDCAPTREALDDVGNQGVVRCSKRRQSMCVKPVAKRMEETLSSDDRPFPKPTGILSSRKKLFSRRSVAFGSPEAAEYNIGSPSVSLTPMPKGRAKALFALPATTSCYNQVDNNHARNDANEYAVNESGMDLLVDKITVEQMNNSPELSPIEKKKTDTDAFQMPSNLRPSQGNSRLGDRTVELETGMKSLLENNMKELKEENSSGMKLSISGYAIESRDNSIELTDSESIASIHSKYEKYTADLVVPIDAQRLDFSYASEPSMTDNFSPAAKEGNTVQLEGNMLSLLQVAENAKSKKKKEDNESNKMESSSSSASSRAIEIKVMHSRQHYTRKNSMKLIDNDGTEEGETVELEENMLSLLQDANGNNLQGESSMNDKMETSGDSVSLLGYDNTSQQFTANLKNANSTEDVEDGKTVELEGNMFSLIQATENNKSQKGENIAIVNLERSADYDISQQFTANLKNTNSTEDAEDGETVELEGNMLSLIQVADGNNLEGNSSLDDKMEVSTDSAPLLVNDDISQQFTANLTNTNSTEDAEDGKTVELERNMLSLIQVTDGSNLEGNSSVNDKMETSTDSASLLVNDDISQQFTGNLKNKNSTEDVEDGNTAELERNMLSLMQVADGNNLEEESSVNDRMETSEDSVSLLVNDDISQQFTGNLKNMSSTEDAEDGKTVELERNMFSLIQVTHGKNLEGESSVDDKMETNEDSVSLLINDDISQQFTGNLKNTSSTENVEDGNTAELEGNMLSLIQVTDGNNIEEESNVNYRMETIEDSASLLVNDDISKKITGGLKNTNSTEDIGDGGTVELERNMLSLLHATENNKSQKGENIIIDRINISTESPRFATSLSGGKMTKASLVTQAANNKTTKLRKEENILIDKSGITADSASFILTDGLYPQKPDSSNNDEICTADTRFDILEDDSAKAIRRKSLSSNSFILDRVDQVQTLVDDITTKQKSSIVDKSVSFSDTTEFIKTFTTDSGSSDDHVENFAAVDVALFASRLFEGLKCEEIQEDGLSDSFSRFGKSDGAIGSIVYERWIQFIEAVCGEVERRIDQEGTAATSLASLVEEDPRFFCMMQNRFQSSDDVSVIQESLESLVQAGQTLIEYEWNSWLATVLESFHGPLTNIPQMFANDGSKLDEALKHCKSLEVNISFMNDRNTKRAKRKSLLRHQTRVTKLEGEIETIESQLSTIKSELEEIEREEINLLKATADCHDIRLNSELYDGLKVTAESSQKVFLSLRGLHSWSIGTISEKFLEFSTIGSCPQTHLKLLYNGTKFGKAHTNILSKIDYSHTRVNALYVYHGAIASFLEVTTKRLMHKAQKSYTKGPIRISNHLQRYAWLAGRLDLIAKEFQVVQRRYNGKLCRNGEGSFSFIVEFKSENSTVVADFTIEPVYPSFPVEVRLDLISGEQDLERIRRALVKNAKPGFGSLSRACAIIQSIN